MTTRRFTLKDETRGRCKIIPASEETLKEFKMISMELFHFFYQIKSIEFSLFIRVGDEIVEYMRPAEFGVKLLDQISLVMVKDYVNVWPLVRIDQYHKFRQMLSNIREEKISLLLMKDPLLDRKTLEVFSNLSEASQMITRGGLNSEASDAITAAAEKLIDNVLTDGIAVGTLSRMVSNDPTLYDHSASVAMISAVIATRLLKKPLPKAITELIARCALYHDVGKTHIPNHVLNKPGKFTPEEFEIMKAHAYLGYEELKKIIAQGAPIEEIAARVAIEHHERFTGNGYPNRLKGRYEDDKEHGIHLFSRIITIADVYSALLMRRVYKPAYDAAEAIKIMANAAQNDYDPDIFFPFLKNVVESLNHFVELEKKGSKGRILVIENGVVKKVS